MIIRNTNELKVILNDKKTSLPSQNCDYIVLHTSAEQWHEMFILKLKHSSNPFLHVALQVSHGNYRLDSIIFTCHRDEINGWFLNAINMYVNDIKRDEPLLQMLEKNRNGNDSAYPMLFMLTTRLDADYSVLSYMAIAPAYRQNGIMKGISLNIMECLMKEFTPEHKVKSFAIHPASYLFFNPTDKALKYFYPDDLQELSCGDLLRCHGRLPDKQIEFFLTETTKEALIKLSLFIPPTVNHVNIIKFSDQLNTSVQEKASESRLSQEPLTGLNFLPQ